MLSHPPVSVSELAAHVARHKANDSQLFSQACLSRRIHSTDQRPAVTIRSECVPKIAINDTVNVFLKTTIGTLAISNHDCFPVLFDKIACVYYILEMFCILALEMACQPREPALCQLYRHTSVPYKPYVHLF